MPRLDDDQQILVTPHHAAAIKTKCADCGERAIFLTIAFGSVRDPMVVTFALSPMDAGTVRELLERAIDSNGSTLPSGGMYVDGDWTELEGVGHPSGWLHS